MEKNQTFWRRMSWNLGEVCNTATYVCNINLLLYVFHSLSFTLTLTVSVLGGVKGCNIIFPICVFILFVFYLRKMASEKIVLFEDLNLFPCHATKKKKKNFSYSCNVWKLLYRCQIWIHNARSKSSQWGRCTSEALFSWHMHHIL